MDHALVDNEWLAVELPEGFDPIAHDELETLMGISYDCMWGVRDTVRHMIICVTWKDSNKLVTRLVSEKDFAKQVNKTFVKRYRKSGYRCDGFFQRAVSDASTPAYGFRFSNTVEGVAQEGELLVFKRGIRCYMLYYYTRSAVARENHLVYEAIVESLELL